MELLKDYRGFYNYCLEINEVLDDIHYRAEWASSGFVVDSRIVAEAWNSGIEDASHKKIDEFLSRVESHEHDWYYDNSELPAIVRACKTCGIKIRLA